MSKERKERKIIAMMFIFIGFLSIFVDYDITLFVFMLALGSLLLFANDDEDYEED